MIFEVRVESKVENIFRFSVHGNGDIVKLHNAQMVRIMLNAFGMQSVKSAKTPLPNGFDMATNN